MGLTLLHKPTSAIKREEVRIGANAWPATLVISAHPRGIIVIADNHAGGLDDPRNLFFCKVLQSYGLGTLMCNLRAAQQPPDGRKELDIQLFVARLIEVLTWIENQQDLAEIPIGLLGTGAGAAATLIVAAHETERVDAVVSHAGRPDLAQAYLPLVRASTLLIVGGQDHKILEFNRAALDSLLCKKQLDIIPKASHEFNEPGTLDVAAGLAGHWFEQHLTGNSAQGY